MRLFCLVWETGAIHGSNYLNNVHVNRSYRGALIYAHSFECNPFQIETYFGMEGIHFLKLCTRIKEMRIRA